jgi:hypothetical protein
MRQKPQKESEMTSDAQRGVGGIPDDSMGELLDLIRGADSVELKLTVPADEHRATIGKLGIDPVDAEPRQVFFFETPGLLLNGAGVVVRARRRPGGRGDTVVKLRPVVPSELPGAVRHSAAFGVEVDAMPGGFVCSGSMKGRIGSDEISQAIAGKIPLREIFSKEQRAFFAAHAPAGLSFESLIPLGPTFLLKDRYEPKGFDRRLVVEMWLYPDGSRILELSTKCLPDEAFRVAAELRAFLGRRGIALTGLQQTKTKTALEFFAKDLLGEEKAEPPQTPQAPDAAGASPRPRRS